MSSQPPMLNRPRWLELFQSLRSPSELLAGFTQRGGSRIETAVGEIRREADRLRKTGSGHLADRAAVLRAHVADGCPATAATVRMPAFALVAEAFRRALGVRLYDQQLLAGLALVDGGVAQMQTGEGKTFAGALPATVHALAGRGVHVMTVNGYLATRDYEQLKPVYAMLGISVGLLRGSDAPALKRAAYRCDVTYGPGHEFGFDFLRDQSRLIARGKPRLGETFRNDLRGQPPADDSIQRGQAVAIVDELDSVLIDEATTPLVLADQNATPTPDADIYRAARTVARQLRPGVDFVASGADGGKLTSRGRTTVNALPPTVRRQALQRTWRAYVETALRAERLFRRGIEYVVRDHQIHLVDQHTGRIFADRNWQDGLQQAIQAKEGLPIVADPTTLARITRQRYFRRYDAVCGMTGTATNCRWELKRVYGLRVTEIPTHQACRRREEPMRAFADLASKRRAIADDVVARHQRGQPVLLGTASIAESQGMSTLLVLRRVPHLVLNGLQDQAEADIVSRAGRLGAVTIATNLAGRGTDIPLGPGAADAGGLHVVVCEPHESARVDRQLIGRTARQGAPGSCQRFLSADDATIVNFDPAWAEHIRRLSGPHGEVAADLLPRLLALQRRVERLRSRQRSRLSAHDDWLEQMLRTFAS